MRMSVVAALFSCPLRLDWFGAELLKSLIYKLELLRVKVASVCDGKLTNVVIMSCSENFLNAALWLRALVVAFAWRILFLTKLAFALSPQSTIAYFDACHTSSQSS